MKAKNEGILSSILRMISGMSKDEFKKAQKDVVKWKKLKKKLEKGTPQDRLLLKKILLKNKNLK